MTAAAPEQPIVAAAPDFARDSVLLFDGECGLCSTAVRWILRHERTDAAERPMWLAALQGETAAGLRAQHPRIPLTVDTVVYVDDGRVHLRSKAFMYLARHLRGPWRGLYYLRFMPGFLPDLGYRLVARFRYRIWGKTDACALPTARDRARLLP